MDEGQDFTAPFYQLCYKLSKNKKIVWAYDDFQNIFDVKIQDERETFGKTQMESIMLILQGTNVQFKILF